MRRAGPLLSTLSVHADVINELRRPGNPAGDSDYCPIRHLEVRGSWAEATGAFGGQAAISTSRVLYLLSQYGVAATIPDPSGVLLGLEPVRYWVSYVFVLHPAYTIQISRRIELGVIAAALEALGGGLQESISAQVSEEMSDAALLAVTRAREGMDGCFGELFLDASGYSRGSPIMSEALVGNLGGARLMRFNSKVRVSYPAAIDVIHEYDPIWRPWALSGSLMRDGIVLRRGNERISSFFATNPSTIFLDLVPWVRPLVADLATFASWNTTQYPYDFLEVQIVGLPRGWDRSGGPAGLSFTERFAGFCAANDCSSFANEEHFPSPIAVIHDKLHYDDRDPSLPPMGYFAPGDIDTSSISLEPSFSLAANTSLGVLINNPRAFDDPPSGVGWAPATDLTADGFFRTLAEEDGDMPVACGGLSQEDPFEVAVVRGCVFEEDGPSADCVASRDLLADTGFDQSRTVVLYSQEFVGNKADMDEIFVAAGVPAEQKAEVERYVTDDSNAGCPLHGPWTQPRCTDSSGVVVPCADGVVLQGGDTGVAANMEAAITEGVSGADGSETLAQNVEAELNALPEDERADRIRYFDSFTSGATPSRTESYAGFPGSVPGTLTQTLDMSSKRFDEMLVQLDVRFRGDTGFLEVALSGPHLDEIRRIPAISPGARVRETFVMARLASAATELGTDTITLRGQNVDVYGASVRPHRVLEDPLTGRLYELVYRQTGTSWEHASELAGRQRYFDLHARLVPPTDTVTMQLLLDSFDVEAPVWVGASRDAGDGRSFLMDDGNEVPSSLWAIAPPWSSSKRLYAALDPALGGLVPLTASVTNVGRPMGYFVEYVPESELYGGEDLCLAYAGVLASWPLDAEDTGGTAFEMRGRYIMSTEGSLPTSGPGLFDAAGSSVVFGGSTLFSAPGDAALSDALVNGNYSVSLWLQPSSTSGEDFLFRAGGPSGDTNGYLDNVMIEVVRVGDELRVLWEESGAVDVSHVTNDLALRAGQTYHIIVSVEESPVSSSYRDVALYVTTPDEGRVFEEVWLDRARVVAGDVSTMIVAVGGDPGSASTSGADGSIDEVTLFSTALGSVEAWELTQSMLGGQLCGAFESACGDHSLSTSGVVSAWFFDEGSPTIIREMENRYPLSLEGSAYPGVTGGLVGSTPGTRGARSFSSTATKMGRALDVPLRDELASSDYSLSFWVQTPGSGYIVSAGGPIGDTGGSLYNVLLEIYVGTDGRLRVLWEHASGANQSFTTNAAVAFGAPHHVLLTVTPTSGSQADATLQVRDAAYNVVIDESWTGLTRPIAGDIAHARWIVGGRNSSTGGFSGVLDNMTLFAASLSTEQSAALYEAERLGVAAAWQLHEHSSDDPAHDAMGRYTLPIYGTALLPVTESLFTHDVRHTGARELGAAPLARIGGNEHLSDLFADFSYTMMASFQPALVSGHRILAIYAGAVGDGYGGRDNYQMELAQSGDEIRVFWEYGTGSNVSMLTGDLNLVAGRVYSLAVTVYDATNPAYRNVLLEVADWTTSTSRQFQWTNKVRAARGTTSRMRLSLGGHPDGSFFHGVLDEVYVFAPAATTRTVHSIWNEYGWDQVLCAPGFTSPVLSNSSQQQSLLLQSSDELAGPAAGTAEGRHQGGEQPINSGPSSSAGEPLEPAALEDDESDDIAFGAPGHYFDAP